MDRRETIERILADVGPVLEDLREDAMREIREAKEKAAANVERHDEAARELGAVESRLETLRSEQGGLRDEHSRALLEDDVEAELRLKDLSAELREEIGRLEALASSLRDEAHRLNPRPTGHFHDASLHQYAQAAGAAHERRAALEGLEERLTRAIRRAVEPVAEEHKQLLGTVQSMEVVRKFDLSPVGQGGIR